MQKIVDNNLLTFVVSALHVGLVVLTFAAVVIAFEADCTADVHFRCKYRSVSRRYPSYSHYAAYKNKDREN